MASEDAIDLIETQSIPSCVDIGLQASKKGDFQMARQMLHTAMEQLAQSPDKQPRLIELITNIADTYLSEGNYDMAKNWYTKALQRSELLHGTNTLQASCLTSRLAQVHILESNLTEYEKCLDNLMRVYLLTAEEDISVLLNPLIDLSWALCIKGHVDEVQSVNELIAQIKQSEEENKLAIFSSLG